MTRNTSVLNSIHIKCIYLDYRLSTSRLIQLYIIFIIISQPSSIHIHPHHCFIIHYLPTRQTFTHQRLYLLYQVQIHTILILPIFFGFQLLLPILIYIPTSYSFKLPMVRSSSTIPGIGLFGLRFLLFIHNDRCEVMFQAVRICMRVAH